MHAFLRNRCPFGALALAPPDPERRSRTNHSLSLDDPDHAATRPPQDALSAWKLTVRAGSRVEHERHDTLDDALHAARAHVTALAPTARRGPTHALIREIEPRDQVAARLELRGPKRRMGGVDLRGDGSLAAWTGRIAKRAVEGDDALAALREVLTADR